MKLTSEFMAFKMKLRRVALVGRDYRTMARELWKTLTAHE